MLRCFVVFVVTFGLCLGLSHDFVFKGVPGGDSGELISEACVLGIAHPPGYPLFIILNHAFMAAVGYNARSANMLSTIFGSTAAGFTALCVLNVGGNYAGAVVGGVLFAFSPLVWRYTIGAEVFALNNLLLSILLFLSTRENVNLKLGAFICGLAMANQHTCVLFEIPLILHAIYPLFRKDPRFWAKLVMSGICFLVGLCTPYLVMSYLVLTRPQQGSWGDIGTVNGLVTHFLRQEYGTLTLSPNQKETESMAERTVQYFVETFESQLVLAILLALTLYQLTRKKTKIKGTGLLAGVLGFYLVVFHSLANLPLDKPMPREVHRRFWIQPHLLVCILAGAGLPKQLAAFAPPIIAYSIWETRQNADVEQVDQYAATILKEVEQNAIILSHTDINWNGIRYRQACLKERLDVTHLSLQMMPYPWFKVKQEPLFENINFPQVYSGHSTDRSTMQNSDYIIRFIKENPDRHIYVDIHSLNDGKLSPDNHYPGGVYFIPQPFYVWKASLHGVDDIEKWRQANPIQKQPTIKASDTPAGSWENAAIKIQWDGVYQRALFILQQALKNNEALPALREATILLCQCINTTSVTEVDVAKNAALASVKLMEREKAMEGTYSKEGLRLAKLATTYFIKIGSRRDPAYARFKAVRDALSQI
mmetsp:Transcript_17594/g.38508  ORF Transcript_17594/g.38508 Transcript_17594/m.38508 type:complete len:650 (-) Transcript_17594:860-2809(-)